MTIGLANKLIEKKSPKEIVELLERFMSDEDKSKLNLYLANEFVLKTKH